MLDITLRVDPKDKEYIDTPELESLLSRFVGEYIETKQDMKLRDELSIDDDFLEINKLIDEKLGDI